MTEETIFQAALEQPTPGDRAAYLDRACAGDPAIRARVEALLRSHESRDSFLDTPAVVRQAEGKAGAGGTTITQPADPLSVGGWSSADGAVPVEMSLAFLAPSGKPGSLGRLDHYEVLGVVGRGGMGIVLKSWDTRLRQVVAVKVLAPELAASGTARQRFFREARSGAAVREEHVVSTHAVSPEDGPTPYLVMEFIAGVTLADRVKARGALSLKEVLRIGMQAATGLAAAHRQGLTHRDIKPANILLENGVERVKIADFGLARAADEARLSRTGVVAGTPEYMSPEQARGEKLDHRSDLFSLGSVLYTLCTGQSAFAAGNIMAVLRRVCEDTPRAIWDINPDIPESLAAVVDRLMAKDPAGRFQTAGELAEVLRQHLAGVQQSSPKSAEGQAVPGVGAGGRRKRVAVVGLLAVGLGVGLVVAAIASRPRPVGQPDEPPDPVARPDESPGPVARPAGLPVPNDPRVLTVSKRPGDQARFDTIRAALDAAKDGMTVRVLDDSAYEELLEIHAQHRGVVLEASRGATLRKPPVENEASIVAIWGVPRFTLRGFRVESGVQGGHAQIWITGLCAGVVLDRLDMTTRDENSCVSLHDVALSDGDAPVVIQNCTMSGGRQGIIFRGTQRNNRDRPAPCRRVVVRNNTVIGAGVSGVALSGEVGTVQVVGNRVLSCRDGGIDLVDFLPNAADILVANNTLWGNRWAIGVWYDHSTSNDFLKCKNVRVQNNLVLDPMTLEDVTFRNHASGTGSTERPGDRAALLASPEWRFGFNWRELNPARAAGRGSPIWIPARTNDRLLSPIDVLSRVPTDPNFLRPPKDSPLAWSGAGGDVLPAAHVTSTVGQAAGRANPWVAGWAVAETMNQFHRSLPAYVGAVPPEGIEPWDWEKTWRALAR